MVAPGLAKLSAISQTGLRAQCTQQLRALIIAGALHPGDLHSIGSVAIQLGVSITPVREALLDLVREELVEMVPNRGFRVVTLTEDDLDELLELRLLLEVPALARIASLRPAADLAPLRLVSEEATRSAVAGDMVGFLTHDRELHLGMLALAGNRRLVATVGLLRDQTRLYGLQQITGTSEFLDSAAEHDQLLDLIEAGDADAAAALTRRHLTHTRGLWAGHHENVHP